MATTKETLLLEQRVQGEMEVQRLQQKLLAYDTALKQLRQSLANGTISQQLFEQATRATTQAQITATDALKRQQRELAQLSKQSQAGMDQVGGAASKSNYKLLQFGNTLDDLQYVGEMGLRPIINNIMQLSPAIGIALIAVDQLYRHWDDLMAAFGSGKVETASEAMKRLADQIARTADEQARYNKLKAIADAEQDIRENPVLSREDRERNERVAGVMREVGQDAIIGPLAAGFKAHGLVDLTKLDDETRKLVEDARKEVDNARKVGLPAEMDGRVVQGMGLAGVKGFGEEVAPEDMTAEQRRLFDAAQDKLNVANESAFQGQAVRFWAEAKTSAEGLDRLIKRFRELGELDIAEKLENALIGAESPEDERKRLDAEFDVQVAHAEQLDQEWEQAKERRTQRAEELAKPLQDRFNESAARTGTPPDTAAVQAELERSGLSSEAASKGARHVAKVLLDNWNRALEEEALKSGITTEEAARRLVAEADEKRQREASRQADAALPALDAQTEANLKGRLAQGMDLGSAQRAVALELTQVLRSQGLSEADARLASEQQVSESGRKLEEDAIQQALKGSERKLFTGSESGQAMMERLQSAALGDVDDRQLREIQRTNQILESLIFNRNANPTNPGGLL